MRNYLRDTIGYFLPQRTPDQLPRDDIRPDDSHKDQTVPIAPPQRASSHRSAFEILLNNAHAKSRRLSAEMNINSQPLEWSNDQSMPPQVSLTSDENTVSKLSGPQYSALSTKPKSGDTALGRPRSKHRNAKGNELFKVADTQQAGHDFQTTTGMSNGHIDLSTAPRKMLQLKPDGRLGSPRTQSESGPKLPQKSRSKRRRKLLAICRYKDDNPGDMAARIDRILESSVLTVTSTAPRSMTVPGTVDEKQPAHPFFTNRDRLNRLDTQQKRPTAPDSPRVTRTVDAVTPGKIRTQLATFRAERDTPPRNFQRRTGTKSKSTGIAAPWPEPGTQHIRGSYDRSVMTSPFVNISARKMKYRAHATAQTNSLTIVRSRLCLAHTEQIRTDGFADPPPSLRVPQRALLTGHDIKTAVTAELFDDVTSITHPAVTTLLEQLPNVMTPWDDGTGELHAWSTKYAPRTSSTVLQHGTEAQLLADWLHSLTTSSIGRATNIGDRASATEQKPKKKRRKKHDGLDDFIISSDEEGLGELEELDPLEAGSADRHDTLNRCSSVVRSYAGSHAASSAQHKVANAVVISGEHGCGKTAMVYAVAKQQGFEVFEISPGSRRNGRDILERVGDMAGNHLVQHRRDRESSVGTADEALQISKASVEADVASGKQGQMTSFFKKHGVPGDPKTKSRKRRAYEVQRPEVNATTKHTRQQKQSLILLEEVDILFEEDKSFWATVLSLIISSKRPVILTCSDESVLPFQELILHAILRLSPASIELTTNYLLCIAAAEGHLLTTQAVETLYRSKRRDLRASINNLQVWCQMGVGDPRGGLGWIFQRYPPGTGIDDHGRTQRVVSRQTFLEGMGCASDPQDVDTSNSTEARTRATLEYWHEWAVDPRDMVFQLAEVSGGLDYDNLSQRNHPRHRLSALKRLASLTDTLSYLDFVAPSGLPDSGHSTLRYAAAQKMHRPDLDLTSPKLSAKVRSDYIEGYRLLQADELPSHADLRPDLCATVCGLEADVKRLSLHSSFDQTQLRAIVSHDSKASNRRLSRADFSALDPVAEAASPSTSVGLAYCSLDGPFRDIAVDIAPYVRSIVRFDLALEEQREHLSGGGVISSQGSSSKKARTTRAARSALEGGQRRTTRRERWFTPRLDLAGVLRTGGCDWSCN